uniref:Cystatin domain-containing protein n=1 Tax=Globodera pallida TaxID=36090 RepID=A0A183C9W2_GLOPA
MHFFLPVLFALVCCVAEDLLEVQLVPSLHADRHKYFVVTKCPNDANDNNKLTICYSDDCQKSSSNTFDLVEMKVASTNCPKEYEIIVGMCNKNKQDWTTWPSVYSANIVMQMHENFKIHHITFGNHFKLAISPAFSEHSKMVYRVNVYCAGIDQYEFKTYTNYVTMVVFNSDQRKCDKYDVKVWPS